MEVRSDTEAMDRCCLPALLLYDRTQGYRPRDDPTLNGLGSSSSTTSLENTLTGLHTGISQLRFPLLPVTLSFCQIDIKPDSTPAFVFGLLLFPTLLQSFFFYLFISLFILRFYTDISIGVGFIFYLFSLGQWT